MSTVQAANSLPRAAQEMIASVLALKPKLAAFDCDGTLWSIDSGEGFMRWEFERGLVRPDVIRAMEIRYEEYKAGRVSEDDMCAEMVTIHQGMPYSELERAAAEFFRERVERFIFPEMKVLVRTLAAQGVELWAISSTNDWVVREGVREFGIPGDHVLAASVLIERGIATGSLLRMPSGIGKALAIEQVVQRRPDVAFGNSKWDEAMLSLAKHAFAINPNPDLEAIAQEKGWKVYQPELP